MTTCYLVISIIMKSMERIPGADGFFIQAPASAEIPLIVGSSGMVDVALPVAVDTKNY